MAEIRIDGARCPYCHDHLGDPRELVACAACGARAHLACHQEHPACATCGGSEILVPRGAAPTDQQPAEPLPADSRLQVERLPDALEISWPALSPPQRMPTIVMGLALTPLCGLGLLTLLWVYRHWNARVHCRMTRDALELDTIASRTQPPQRYGRSEVQMIDRQGTTRLYVRTERKRQLVATATGLGTVVTLGDVAWLADTLHAWSQARLALGPAQPDAAPPPRKPDPKRDPKQLERG